MAVIKVVEIMAVSTLSWEDAAKIAVKNAAKTINNIKSIYVKEQLASVTGENITEFRVILKLSFEVADKEE